MARSRVVLGLAIAAFATIFVLFPALSGVLTDWWWFQEVGLQVVFTRQLVTQLLLFLAVGALTSAVLLWNLRIARGAAAPGPLVVPFGETQARPLPATGVHRAATLIALALGVITGLVASAAWRDVLQLIYGAPFGIKDPVFGHDIGYYVFTLPGLETLLGLVSGMITLSLIATVVLYLLRARIVLDPRAIRVERAAGMHLAVLIAAAFTLTAVRLWVVGVPRLLYSTTGPLVGVGYTDMHAVRPALHLMAILALVGAGAVIVGARRGLLARYAVVTIGGYIGLSFLTRDLLPQFIQKFVVAPTELTREMPYLRYHIAATRQAWGLDSVESRELSGDAPLTLDDLKRNAPTIENVRLWDRDPLLQTFGQLQEIRTYYDFVSVDDDRYWIDGKYRQVLLSPRELNVASLPTRTFINEHLTFTHGMGLTIGPVNQVTVEGLPVLFVKDLPPVSTVSLKVTRPQIYFGELSNDWVVVGTQQREFDHPAGDENVYASYQGTGGVSAGGFLKRLVFASRFGSSNLLFSGDVTPASRVLFNRNVVARARQALPMLDFDRDPYLVIAADGKLVWILDGYTSTTRYPYSQTMDNGTTYMRNSVKVVVDAYDGTIRAYVSAPSDPIITTWTRVFPGIFQSMDRMPKDLVAHLRYPDELFQAQSALYTTYHMDAPEDFYHREDQWQIPATDQGDGAAGAVPFMRHIIMRLPDEKDAEFIYMVPFSPRGKDNLAAWMVARNDGTNYGKLRVYRLSRQSLVFGPRQIENRINQNTEISRQVTLWDQRGSKVIRGDLLVIPIEKSLLYVQPLYLQAEGGRIPELKRVVVAYQNQVVMESTLEGALTSLFGNMAGGGAKAGEAVGAVEPLAVAGPVTVDASLQPLVDEARRHYQNAMEAQREGDWARYGTEIKQLGQVLERIGAGAGSTKSKR
ncbi:MAG: UPF0182 family protein [Gemmatimonadaceae bacterium]